MQVQALGMVWYRPETFAELKAMFEDGHKLHASYEEWLSAAENGRKQMEARGAHVVCVDIDPKTFPVWCKERGLKLDANARNEYASLFARNSLDHA